MDTFHECRNCGEPKGYIWNPDLHRETCIICGHIRRYKTMLDRDHEK